MCIIYSEYPTAIALSNAIRLQLFTRVDVDVVVVSWLPAAAAAAGPCQVISFRILNTFKNKYIQVDV